MAARPVDRREDILVEADDLLSSAHSQGMGGCSLLDLYRGIGEVGIFAPRLIEAGKGVNKNRKREQDQKFKTHS
jgi:hypothetical protein